MQNRNYSTFIETNAPASEVYTAINTVQKWWTENVSGNTANPDDEFTVTFGETYINLKVLELIENRKVVWLVTDSYKHFLTNTNEWNGTKIAFEIDDGKLVFNHFGLEPELECYDICRNGWNHYVLGSLKSLIENGTGNPDRKK